MMKTSMQPNHRDYEIRIWYSAEKGDECFIAQVVEWPAIMAHGDTREEAARQIQLALEGALQVAAEQAIKRARGILKRKPGERSFRRWWADYKKEERALEEARYGRLRSR